MESVARLSSIPVVESGLRSAEDVYFRIKKSNRLFSWSFDKFETTLFGAVDTLRPGFKLFEGTICQFDKVVCKSLDLMEQKVPDLYLPPSLLYFNTKNAVIKRAESFKELGNSVLDSPLDRLDHFVDAADKYVERYLPESNDDRDEVDHVLDENKNNQNGDCAATETHVIQTIHRGQKFSKKLKRRLTIRTIAEAKALKKQSREAIHVLFYAAELIVTDPKQAFQKTKELWAYLSEPEPGNQARPENLEQLIVLLTRESARRVVHFINFTRNAVVRFPETLRKTQYTLMQQLIRATKALINLIRTRPITTRLSHEVATFQAKLSGLYDEVQNYATNRLVNIDERSDGDRHGNYSSMALVPFRFQTSTNDGHPTNITSPFEYHLTFQCNMHAVISAEQIAIYVSGRLSEEKALLAASGTAATGNTNVHNTNNNHRISNGAGGAH